MDELVKLATDVSGFEIKNDSGSPCYASTAGSLQAMITSIIIQVSVYGDENCKAMVTQSIERHAAFMRKTYKV